MSLLGEGSNIRGFYVSAFFCLGAFHPLLEQPLPPPFQQAFNCFLNVLVFFSIFLFVGATAYAAGLFFLGTKLKKSVWFLFEDSAYAAVVFLFLYKMRLGGQHLSLFLLCLRPVRTPQALVLSVAPSGMIFFIFPNF